LGDKYQVTCAAVLPSLATFRDFIDRSCEPYPNIDPQACYDIKLAVDEACTNVIQHGYLGMNPGSIILALEISDQKVDIAITDFGHPFEPAEPDKPDVEADFEEGELSGFGLFFIYETMDEIDYETSPVGNNLYFVKQLLKS
jgi:serine/threonine-protein kinase RsbW